MKPGTWVRNRSDGGLAAVGLYLENQVAIRRSGEGQFEFLRPAEFNERWARFRPATQNVVHPIWVQPSASVESRNPCVAVGQREMVIRRVRGSWLSFEERKQGGKSFIISLEEFLRNWRPVFAPTRFERVG